MSDFNSQKNRAVWFDIPFQDLERACTFYRAVLAIDVNKEKFGDIEFAVLAHEDGNGGCLVPAQGAIQPKGGILLYLNADGRIRDAVSKVQEFGGHLVQDIHAIGAHGFRALIRDSEGNHMALHSNSDA